jgi:hypothetical protein
MTRGGWGRAGSGPQDVRQPTGEVREQLPPQAPTPEEPSQAPQPVRRERPVPMREEAVEPRHPVLPQKEPIVLGPTFRVGGLMSLVDHDDEEP